MRLATLLRLMITIILFSYLKFANASVLVMSVGEQTDHIEISRLAPNNSVINMSWSINRYNFLLNELSDLNHSKALKIKIPFSLQKGLTEQFFITTKIKMSFEEKLLSFHKIAPQDQSEKAQKSLVKVSEPNSLYILLVAVIGYIFLLQNKALNQHLRNI